MSLVVDRHDLDFVLFEMLGIDALAGTDRYATYDRATIRQMIDAAQQFAETRFLPIAAEIDRDEPRFVDGAVEMPESAAEALRAHAEAGYFSLPFDEASGGLQAPWVLHTAISGIFVCANTAVANYAFLTTAAAHLLESFGSEELKRRFIPPMLTGRWFGTMCLSEPQAGSSLADIRTTATPVGGEEGVYRITGTKTWISGGDQNISDNIVHMVIAKIPGGPAGTKGISLFLVPKVRVSADGTLGPRNNVVLAGLNHKMGQRGTTNCLLNFGEGGDCLGFLLGEPHRGIEYMFQMMNEARIEVGHSATMQGLAGYLYSADYARTRLQGRPVGDRDPTREQVPIIEHADVKRMLLAQKAAVEGAQALCLYSAWLVDKMATETDETRRA